MVLFSVCNAITVECCVLYPWCMGVFGMIAVVYGRMLFSSVGYTVYGLPQNVRVVPVIPVCI